TDLVIHHPKPLLDAETQVVDFIQKVTSSSPN
ncbi:unnamed protein product, partial [Rotaria magnacalcarata]